MRKTIYSYHFQTREGEVALVPDGNRYCVWIDGDNLGSYHSAMAAAEDVAGDHVGPTRFESDLDKLGISEELGEWERRVFAYWKGVRPA